MRAEEGILVLLRELGMTQPMSKWKLVNSAAVFQSPWLEVKKKAYLQEGLSGEQDYYVVERLPFVVVVALHQTDLLMVRHFRHGTDETYLELPAGYRDGGESAIAAAQRELLEETGYEAGTSTLLGELHPLPGYIRSSASVVLCRDLRDTGTVIDANEIEQVLRVPATQVIQMILRGEINEMQAVSAILLAHASSPLC